MAFYFNQSLSKTASAYTQFTTMLSAMVASGIWSYVTSSEASGIVSVDDDFSDTLPFYIQYVKSSDNEFSVSFRSSDWVTPYFTLNTSATTGLQNYDITINAYDSGFTFYASQIQTSTSLYTGTILLNIERGRSLDGEKLSDIVAFGYLARKSTSFPKLTNTYTSEISATISNYFTVLDAIGSTTAITAHDTGRPAFLKFGSGGTDKGQLSSNPYFNPETLSLLSAGPFPYASSAKKLYGNPYLLTCVTSVSNTTVTSTSQYPYLMELSTDVDFMVGGVKRTFWVPPYCISEGSGGSERYYMYYLLAKE